MTCYIARDNQNMNCLENVEQQNYHRLLVKVQISLTTLEDSLVLANSFEDADTYDLVFHSYLYIYVHFIIYIRMFKQALPITY